MVYDLLPLLSGIKSVIDIEESINFSKDKFINTSITDMNEVKVKGYIKGSSLYLINLYLEINTTIYIKDALTGELISYPISLVLDKNIGETEEEDENYQIIENTLDILPIIWENIVLEVPLRVVKDDKEVTLEGDGWSLNKNESTNPLSELKELLDMEERK